jgi:hypothetical protein
MELFSVMGIIKIFKLLQAVMSIKISRLWDIWHSFCLCCISTSFQNPKVLHRVHKSPLLLPVLSQCFVFAFILYLDFLKCLVSEPHSSNMISTVLSLLSDLGYGHVSNPQVTAPVYKFETFLDPALKLLIGSNWKVY